MKSITSWRKYTSDWAQDVDGSPAASQQLLQTLSHWAWTEELRLNSSIGEAFDYTVGAFYMDQDGTLKARVDLNYAGIDFIHGPDPTPSTSQALFAQGCEGAAQTQCAGGIQVVRHRDLQHGNVGLGAQVAQRHPGAVVQAAARVQRRGYAAGRQDVTDARGQCR